MNRRFKGIGHHEDDLKIQLRKYMRKAAGQRDPSMTKLYARRGNTPKKGSLRRHTPPRIGAIVKVGVSIAAHLLRFLSHSNTQPAGSHKAR
jgi:hypothetical protein